jgi:hypothetical protein
VPAEIDTAPPAAKACDACYFLCKREAKFCPRCGYRFASPPSPPFETETALTSHTPPVGKPFEAETQREKRSPPSAEDKNEAVQSELATPPVSKPAETAKTQPALSKNPPVSSAAKRSAKPFAIGAAVLAAVGIAGAGAHQYFAKAPASPNTLETKSSADGVPGVTKAGATELSGSAVAPNAQQSPMPTAAAAAEQTVPTNDAAPATGTTEEKKPTPGKAQQASRRTASKASAPIPSAARKEATAASSAQPTTSPQQTAELSMKKTCQSTNGIYRVTCEIEGAERYFRCAPDGKTWSHVLPECDRRSTNTR